MVRKNLEALWAGVRYIRTFFSSRDKYVNIIALARKSHCQKLKTLRESRTERSRIRLPVLSRQAIGIERTLKLHSSMPLLSQMAQKYGSGNNSDVPGTTVQ